MDANVVAQLTEAGIDVQDKRAFPQVQLRTDGKVLKPIEWEVDFLVGTGRVSLRMKNVRDLFTGTRQPPAFTAGPPASLMRPVVLLSRTAMACCTFLGRPEKDLEFERLFSQLRRRPDGKDVNPVFSYLRAVSQYYLSSQDMSAAEFEAVTGWLARLAKHQATGPASANLIPHLQKAISVPPLPGR